MLGAVGRGGFHLEYCLMGYFCPKSMKFYGERYHELGPIHMVES